MSTQDMAARKAREDFWTSEIAAGESDKEKAKNAAARGRRTPEGKRPSLEVPQYHDVTALEVKYPFRIMMLRNS